MLLSAPSSAAGMRDRLCGRRLSAGSPPLFDYSDAGGGHDDEQRAVASISTQSTRSVLQHDVLTTTEKPASKYAGDARRDPVAEPQLPHARPTDRLPDPSGPAAEQIARTCTPRRNRREQLADGRLPRGRDAGRVSITTCSTKTAMKNDATGQPQRATMAPRHADPSSRIDRSGSSGVVRDFYLQTIGLYGEASDEPWGVRTRVCRRVHVRLDPG